jgi:hypothetical protein
VRIEVTEKWCNGCKRTLPESAFGRVKSGKQAGRIRARCRKCETNATKVWQANNRERNLAHKKNYRATHREAYLRYHRRKNWTDAGMDPDAVEALLAQYDCCMICGSQNRLVPDHDHETLELRGILCHLCNTGIGFLRDSPEILGAAIVYLERTP